MKETLIYLLVCLTSCSFSETKIYTVDPLMYDAIHKESQEPEDLRNKETK